MLYRIAVQYAKDNVENPLKKEFDDLEEAKKFIKDQIKQDALCKTKVIYRLYKNYDELVEEFDSSKVEISSPSKEDQGSKGKTSQSTFRPTPLNMTPTPPGLPKKWIIDKDEDDKKKDK